MITQFDTISGGFAPPQMHFSGYALNPGTPGGSKPAASASPGYRNSNLSGLVIFALLGGF
jgi:hypothetical protein